MKKFIEKCKKWLPEKPFLYWIKFKNWFFGKPFLYAILGIEIAFILGFIVLLWDDLYAWLGLSAPNEQAKYSAEFYRNRGFFAFAIAGLLLTAVGMMLTIWGRIQTEQEIILNEEANAYKKDEIAYNKDQHIDKKYNDAVIKLSDSALAVRIDSCNVLKNVGVSNRNIAAQCIQLLLLFIKNPYLNEKEAANIKGLSDEEILEVIFPENKSLRLDIQAAANAFTTICEYYFEKSEALDLEIVDLPSYFWKNLNKGKISLPNSEILSAKLKGAFLRRVNLWGSRLDGTDFEKAKLIFANLQHTSLRRSNFANARLWGAKLQNARLSFANLSGAEMRGANLSGANLSRTNLSEAYLQGAIFFETEMRNANLSNADLSGAELSDAKYLQKNQVLSATWGYERSKKNRIIEPSPPELSDNLLQDEDIQKWLKKPHHNKYDKNYKSRDVN